jgi:iron complex outermembrane receptor protein
MTKHHHLRLTFVIITLVVIFARVSGQITGKVVDANTGEPIIAANVYHVSSRTGTITDTLGRFTLPRTRDFTISAVGYKSLHVQVADSLPGPTGIYRLTPDNYRLTEVMVTEMINPVNRKNIPASITVIDRKKLNRIQTFTLDPVLHQAPGLFMHTGTRNTSRITIRGIGSRSPYSTSGIKAYLNNIPLTNGEGETFIEDVDAFLLKEIEVVKGPASSLHGAALGGAIIMKTKGDQEFEPFLEVNSTVGSFGLFNTKAAVFLNHNQQTLINQYTRSRGNGFRENNKYQRDNYLLSGDFKIMKSKLILSPLLMVTRLHAGIPSSLDSFTYIMNPSSAANHWEKSGGNEKYTKLFTGLNAAFYLKNFHHKISFFGGSKNALENRPFNFLDEESFFGGARYVIHYPTKNNRNWNISAGSEFYLEDYAYATFNNINGEGEIGDISSDNKEIRRYLNTFSRFQSWLFPKILFSASLNYNQTFYQYHDLMARDSVDLSGDYKFSPVLSPRLGISYINREVTFFASVSHGFNTPLLSETLTPSGEINPSIKMEQAWNYEIGSRAFLLNNRLKYDITLFNLQVKDLLVAKRIGPDAYVGVNAGSSSHVGIELSSDWRPKLNINGLYPGFYMDYTYARYMFKNFETEGEDYSGNFLPGIPDHHLIMGLEFSISPGFFTNLQFKHVSKMYLGDENTLTTEPYQVVFLKAGYQFTIYNNIVINTHVGINNLFDEKHASMILVNAPSFGGNDPRYYYPGKPRNFYAGIEIKFTPSASINF